MEIDLLTAYMDILKETHDNVPTDPEELVEMLAVTFGVNVSEQSIREFVEGPFTTPTQSLIEEEDIRIHMHVLGYA